MSRIVDFYRGRAPDDAGRTIVSVWGFDAEMLEWRHDFIQWLFPLRSPSGANPSAPVLTDDDVRAFREDPALRARLGRSLDLMLCFYGYAREGDGPATRIVETPDAAARRENWVTPGNHNFLRLTRILRSLTLLGLGAEAAALHGALARLYEGEAGPVIGPRTFQFWLEAVTAPDAGVARAPGAGRD
ncbi:MAG: opioid growth factor receptor-related protein [Vicinamibacterales bacterium]